MRANHREHNLFVQQLATKNLGSFWRIINSYRNDCALPNVMNLDDLSASDGVDITNLFSSHFKSVFKIDKNFSTCPSLDHFSDHEIVDIDENSQSDLNRPISFDEVKSALQNLKNSYFCAPDGVPSVFIKKSGHLLLYPLWVLFNKSLQLGIVPDKWKHSYINPIHKEGSKESIKNYRQICLLSPISSLLEFIINVRLLDKVKVKISPRQHGFMPGKSTSPILYNYLPM